MIKSNYKKIVSAMLLMTMIATMYSTNVFAGGDMSAVTVNCEGIFKDCCTSEIKLNNNNQNSQPNKDDKDSSNYKFNKNTGHLTLLSTYKGTEPIATYMDKSQLESIKTVTIERGIIRLIGTFQNCYNLTSVIIPDTVKEIGENAFADCKELESITIPSSVTKIGDYAFKGCTGLKEVTNLDNVAEVSKNAFKGCTGLSHATTPNSALSYGYKGLTPITMPPNVETVITRIDSPSQSKGIHVSSEYVGTTFAGKKINKL